MQIGYARVSIHDQNLNLQTDAFKRTGHEKIVVDVASAKNDAHSGLEKLRELMRKGDGGVGVAAGSGRTFPAASH